MSIITDLLIEEGPVEISTEKHGDDDRATVLLNCSDGWPFMTLSVDLDDGAFDESQLAAVKRGEIFAVTNCGGNELLGHVIENGMIEVVGYTSANPVSHEIYPLAKLVNTSKEANNSWMTNLKTWITGIAHA